MLCDQFEHTCQCWQVFLRGFEMNRFGNRQLEALSFHWEEREKLINILLILFLYSL